MGTFPYLFYNKSRPLLPFNSQSIVHQNRSIGYFRNRPELYKEYQNLVEAIHINPYKNSIAFHLGGDTWDYPFWIMLKEKYDDRIPYIYHLKKENYLAFLYPNLYQNI